MKKETKQTTTNKKDFEKDVLIQLSNIDDSLELLNNNLTTEVVNQDKLLNDCQTAIEENKNQICIINEYIVEQKEKEKKQEKTFWWTLLIEWLIVLFAIAIIF